MGAHQGSAEVGELTESLADGRTLILHISVALPLGIPAELADDPFVGLQDRFSDAGTPFDDASGEDRQLPPTARSRTPSA